MRFVIQRVTQSSVSVDGTVIGKIGKGLLVLIGVAEEDTEETADKLVRKLNWYWGWHIPAGRKRRQSGRKRSAAISHSMRSWRIRFL